MLSSIPQGLVRFLRALSSPVQKETSISKLSRDPACISHPCCVELDSNWLGALTASIINLCCLDQCSNWWGAPLTDVWNSALTWTGVFLLQEHILYLFQRVKLVFQCGYQSVWSWKCGCSCFSTPPFLSSRLPPTHHRFFQRYLVLLIPEPFEDSTE